MEDDLDSGPDLVLPFPPRPLLLGLSPLLRPPLRPDPPQPGPDHLQGPQDRAQRLLQPLQEDAGGALLTPPLPPGGQLSDTAGPPGLSLHWPGSTPRGLGPGAAGDCPGPGDGGAPGGLAGGLTGGLEGELAESRAQQRIYTSKQRPGGPRYSRKGRQNKEKASSVNRPS